MKKLKILEKHVRKAIIDYLNIKGVFWFWNLQGLGSYPGLPDLACVYRGYFIAIEVKRPGGKLSDNQQIFKDNVLMNGRWSGRVQTCIAIVADDVQIVMDLVEELK